MLGASYQLYRHTGINGTTGTILRTISYTLPVVLYDHVKTVAPTTSFASTQTLRRTPRRHTVGEMQSRELATALSSRNDDGGNDDTIRPSKLRSLYRTGVYMPTQKVRNRLGIAGFLEDFPNRTDLRTFLTKYRTDTVLDAVDADFRVVPINGGLEDSDSSIPTNEANLNTQYTHAIAYPTPQIFYSTGGRQTNIQGSSKLAENDMWFEWLNYMLHNEPNLPQTISIPYSGPEHNLPQQYTYTLCEMFCQLGLRGVTVLVSSGNDGVGKGSCEDEDGIKQFVPMFPSSCKCSVLSLLGSSTPSQAQFSHTSRFCRSLGH